MMKHLIRLALVTVAATFLTLSMASTASAQQSVQMAPGCGVPVYVMPNALGGQATFYFGRPIIIVDPNLYYGDQTFLQFLLQHECGHFELRHDLPQAVMTRLYFPARLELDADCYAAQHVPRQVALHAARYFMATQGPFSPGLGYPTGNERAANIQRCAGGTDDFSLIDNVLLTGGSAQLGSGYVARNIQYRHVGPSPHRHAFTFEVAGPNGVVQGNYVGDNDRDWSTRVSRLNVGGRELEFAFANWNDGRAKFYYRWLN